MRNLSSKLNLLSHAKFNSVSAAALLLCSCVAFAQGPGLASSVNPIIGTGAGPGGGVNLFPGPATPFGMVQLSPDNEGHGYGYHYAGTDIQGFSMTHMSGPGCANEGDVFFTATTGPVHTQVADLQSPYSHSMETAAPGYYQVNLLRWDIDAQLSATDHTGIAQFTFPAGAPANILVPISHTMNFSTGASIQIVGDRQIEGYVEDRAFCGNQQTYKVYFVMEFSEPFEQFGTWSEPTFRGPDAVEASSRTATQDAAAQWIGAYATWPCRDASAYRHRKNRHLLCRS